MDNASRIYGDAWFEFLGSSRTMLGCESGSNAFDFDGRLDEAIKAFTALHGRRPTYQEFKDALDPLEAPFDVGQISPRVFECAMMMTPMILFRGRYSHAIQADVHYIPLEASRTRKPYLRDLAISNTCRASPIALINGSYSPTIIVIGLWRG